MSYLSQSGTLCNWQPVPNAIQTRVKATSPTLMCDSEVQNQRHQTLRLREVDIQINVPTSLTPTPSHLLSFNLVGCVKEVRNLINQSPNHESSWHPRLNFLETQGVNVVGRLVGDGVNSVKSCDTHMGIYFLFQNHKHFKVWG